MFARMGGHLYFSLCTFLVNIYLLKKERRLPLEGIVLETKKEKETNRQKLRLIETEWDSLNPKQIETV